MGTHLKEIIVCIVLLGNISIGVVVQGVRPTQPRQILRLLTPAAVSACLLVSSLVNAKPEGVNKPELLPSERTSVIDVANFLRF